MPQSIRVVWDADRIQAKDGNGSTHGGLGDMEIIGQEIHLSEVEASGGDKGHFVRWVLGVSLTLVISLLSIIWLVGALS